MSAMTPAEVPLLLSTDTERPERPNQRAAPDAHRQAATPRKVRDGLVHSLLRNRKAVAGLIILAIFVLVALLAPILVPGDPSTDHLPRGAAALGRAPARHDRRRDRTSSP